MIVSEFKIRGHSWSCGISSPPIPKRMTMQICWRKLKTDSSKWMKKSGSWTEKFLLARWIGAFVGKSKGGRYGHWIWSKTSVESIINEKLSKMNSLAFFFEKIIKWSMTERYCLGWDNIWFCPFSAEYKHALIQPRWGFTHVSYSALAGLKWLIVNIPCP